MTDLNRLHNKVAESTRISFAELVATANLISREPREDWPLLVSVLGLDGIPTHLNTRAKSDKAKAETK